MFNVNFNFGSQTALGGGFPGMSGGFPGTGGLAAGMPAMAPMQQMFAMSMNMMQTAMMGLMSQLTGQQVPLFGNSGFGGGSGGGMLQGSPLSSFLGNTSGSSVNGSRTKGSKIPGGKSLYKSGMFHKGAKGAPNSYAFENTPAGIKFAAKRGYSSIDLDMLITKDGVPVATHWAKPMAKDGFYDPQGKLGKNTKVSDMTLAQVMRLRNRDGQSRIYPMSTMIKELKKNGIAGDLEAKNDPRFATDRVMGYLAGLVRDSGIKANLKSINRGPLSGRILNTAQEHGFWVRTAKGNGHKRKLIGYGS